MLRTNLAIFYAALCACTVITEGKLDHAPESGSTVDPDVPPAGAGQDGTENQRATGGTTPTEPAAPGDSPATDEPDDRCASPEGELTEECEGTGDGAYAEGDECNETRCIDPPKAYEATFYANTRTELFRIDVDSSSAEATLVDRFSLPDTEDMADIAETPDGSLYGISLTHLYRIDPLSGKVKKVGPHHLTDKKLDANALTATADGSLYAMGYNHFYPFGSRVFQIDPDTAQATLVASLAAPLPSTGGIAWASQTEAYASVDEDNKSTFWLLKLNPMTGEVEEKFRSHPLVSGLTMTHGGHLVGVTEHGKVLAIDTSDGSFVILAESSRPWVGSS